MFAIYIKIRQCHHLGRTPSCAWIAAFVCPFSRKGLRNWINHQTLFSYIHLKGIVSTHLNGTLKFFLVELCLYSEVDFCHLQLRMASMEKDWILKKLANVFKLGCKINYSKYPPNFNVMKLIPNSLFGWWGVFLLLNAVQTSFILQSVMI